jgi:anti-sigma regulatory factor (Ser/Thr protein kinase)
MTSNHDTPYAQAPREHTWRTLVEFTLPGGPGSERLAVDRVTAAVQSLNWSAAQLEQLKLALAQAARKAAESSFRHDSEGELLIRVLTSENAPATQAVDPAHGQPTQRQVADGQIQPVGRPPSRGWGFFLIEKTAPGSDGVERHLLELFLYPGGK